MNMVKYGFALLTAMAGVQSAFAQCAGTLHFKLPDYWGKVYISAFNKVTLIPTTAYNPESGYYEFDLADANSKDPIDNTFSLTTSTEAPLRYVLKDKWNAIEPMDSNYPQNNRDIECPGAGKDVWVLENPKEAGKTLVSYKKPDIKMFYVLLPESEDWWSSTPMWSPDGTYESRKPLKVDGNFCGWFYVAWVDEKLPEKFILFQEGDKSLKGAIGFDGLGKTLKPISMSDLFNELDVDTISFIPESKVAEENGVDMFISSSRGYLGVDGICSYALYATYYDTDARLHGAFTCDAYPHYASNGCYAVDAPYNYPGAGASETVPCIGVTPGIVKESLDPATKKPAYNAESGCFVSEDAFNVMFRETKGVNVKHDNRYLMMSRNEYGFWEFDSYYYAFSDRTEAFTPLNDLKDSVALETCKGVCATAATLREEYGAVRYGQGSSGSGNMDISKLAQETLGEVANWSDIEPKTHLPYIDLYPVSAGEFANGDVPNVYDVFSWDERVKSEGNQHFCMEMHGEFKYRDGAFLSVRGDDDIWVFVDNKLAIDLGGLHMPAPSYVSLDDFVGNTGKLKAGMEYDFDMFYCDRRTSMSNLRLVTNLYIHNDDPWHTTSVKKPSVAAVKNGQSGFAVRNSARSTLTIAGGLAGAKFAVMDLQGRVVRQGNLSGAETVVPDLMNGSYIVKVGRETRRVNIR